jgi:hypothetical protein
MRHVSPYCCTALTRANLWKTGGRKPMRLGQISDVHLRLDHHQSLIYPARMLKKNTAARKLIIPTKISRHILSSFRWLGFGLDLFAFQRTFAARLTVLFYERLDFGLT